MHSGVDHLAHSAGALLGVLLLWLFAQTPIPEDQPPKAKKEEESSKAKRS